MHLKQTILLGLSDQQYPSTCKTMHLIMQLGISQVKLSDSYVRVCTLIIA